MTWQLTLHEIPSLGVVETVAIIGNYVDMLQCYDHSRLFTMALREFQLAETYFSMCIRVL